DPAPPRDARGPREGLPPAPLPARRAPLPHLEPLPRPHAHPRRPRGLARARLLLVQRQRHAPRAEPRPLRLSLGRARAERGGPGRPRAPRPLGEAGAEESADRLDGRSVRSPLRGQAALSAVPAPPRCEPSVREDKREMLTVSVPFLGGAVIGILVAIALPGFLEARKHGNEASAIGALKTIAIAEAIFRESDLEQDGNLDYGMLSELAAATSRGKPLIDAELGSGTKQGYLLQATYS